MVLPVITALPAAYWVVVWTPVSTSRIVFPLTVTPWPETDTPTPAPSLWMVKPLNVAPSARRSTIRPAVVPPLPSITAPLPVA